MIMEKISSINSIKINKTANEASIETLYHLADIKYQNFKEAESLVNERINNAIKRGQFECIVNIKGKELALNIKSQLEKYGYKVFYYENAKLLNPELIISWEVKFK